MSIEEDLHETAHEAGTCKCFGAQVGPPIKISHEEFERQRNDIFLRECERRAGAPLDQMLTVAKHRSFRAQRPGYRLAIWLRRILGQEEAP